MEDRGEGQGDSQQNTDLGGQGAAGEEQTEPRPSGFEPNRHYLPLGSLGPVTAPLWACTTGPIRIPSLQGCCVSLLLLL